MRTNKIKLRHKYHCKGELISHIPLSFKRKIDIIFIHKKYRYQIGHDECHRRNAGGYFCSDSNPMFTSRNSHKKTNKK